MFQNKGQLKTSIEFVLKARRRFNRDTAQPANLLDKTQMKKWYFFRKGLFSDDIYKRVSG